ncbi:diguanylate cyclase [Dyella sp. ASV21]|uniref:diguanylate cyclase domain-containing protein n=1 Tax=Dyella sp. ASV21 TaxID=2795114 RepID=UPI0018EDA608|nr:diguanylate cyclase [Dyella sp. ASV21]
MYEQQARYRDGLALLARMTGLFAAVLITSVYSLALGVHFGGVVPIWLPGGIVAGVALMARPRDWLPYFLAAFLAFMVAEALTYEGAPHHRLPMSLAFSVADMLDILIVVMLVRRRFPQLADNPHLLHYRALGRVGIIATVLGSAACALLGAAVDRAANGLPFWSSVDTWFRAHLLGMVIVATLTLVLLRQRSRMLGEPGKRLRLLFDVILLTLVTVGVFAQSQYPLLFLIFPPLLYLVYQHRFAGLVIGIGLVATVTNHATAWGWGPFNLLVNHDASMWALLAQVFLGALCVVALPVALAMADRRLLLEQLEESESRYRLLADYATDLIMRVARDGTRRYVSPSVKEMLGWEIDEYIAQGRELIHPDDRSRVREAAEHLWQTGKPMLTQYRIRRRDGEYLWIEALARVAPSPDHPGESELFYTGRDITESVLAEQALAESELRLRTITDNVPAIIAQVDSDQRYTFINAYACSMVGLDSTGILGRTIEEVRGATLFPLLKPHVERAMNGQATTFEYESDASGRHRHLQATYLPVTNARGEHNGFYTLTTDITEIKHAEQQLSFLAHHDALTGIANRLSFHDGITEAIRHASARQSTLLAIMIDVDHFKQINDTYGHAAGDTALREVAERLTASVRKTDLLARLGGDEFVILCHDIDSPATAEALAEKIMEAMRAPVMLGAIPLRVTLSIGMALCRDINDADALLQHADDALYRAKENGRDGYHLMTQGL